MQGSYVLGGGLEHVPADDIPRCLFYGDASALGSAGTCVL